MAPASMRDEGGLYTLAYCASWSLLNTLCFELLPCISESASDPVASPCLLLQALLLSVFPNILVFFLPTPKPHPLLQAVHTQSQGSKLQKGKGGTNIKRALLYSCHTEHTKTYSKAGFRQSSPSSNVAINRVLNLGQIARDGEDELQWIE